MGKFADLIKSMRPRNGRLIDEEGTAQNHADLIREMRGAMDPFGALRVTQYQPVFSVKPLSVSIIDDRTFTSGSSAITVEKGEYKLTNPGGETCRLETSQRGRYQPGLVGVPGVGARRTTEPTGTTTYWIGYFDTENGFGFKEDANGLYTFVRRDGVEIFTQPRSEWIDPLDGTGPSGRKVDLLDGKIVRLPFLWYGYGTLTMAIIAPDDDGVEDDELIPVSRFRPRERTSLINANLPISVEITGDNAGEIYVGGRQYGVFGKLNLRRRISGELRTGQSVDDTWTPLISARVRQTDPWDSVPLQVAGVGLSSDSSIDWYIVVGGTLNGASWNVSQFSQGDSSVEFDTSATDITGGEIIAGPSFLTTGTTGNASGGEESEIPEQQVPVGEPVTLIARARAGNTATVRSSLRCAELR